MAYATVGDLKARAGRLSAAWTAGSVPSDPGDLQRFIDSAAAKIDAAVSAYSPTVPVAGTAAEALSGLNANMAALDALRATFPAKTGPSEAAELIESLDAQTYGKDGEFSQLASGLHPVVTLLRQSSDAPTATSFWTDEPDYGRVVDPLTLLNTNPMMLPAFSRLSKL